MKSCSVAERVTNDEFKFCISLQLFGFLGQFHKNASYHYFSASLPNEFKPAAYVYNCRKSRKGGHDFANEQECVIEAVDLVDLKANKFVFSIE